MWLAEKKSEHLEVPTKHCDQNLLKCGDTGILSSFSSSSCAYP
jgi:hypothetical protein